MNPRDLKKKALIITYYWPPSGGAGVQRWLKFTKFLPEFGWEPIVLTVDPEFATYPLADRSLLDDVPQNLTVVRTRSREWFSAYKKTAGTKNVPYGGFAGDGERISALQKIARFLRGNFFIPDPRKGWNRFAFRRAVQLINQYQPACVITTGPPHSTHLIGKKLQKTFGIHWIADFRDPWTDIFYYRKFYPTILAHRANLRLERAALVNADSIVTVSHGFKHGFLQKTSVPGKKIAVIPNGYDETDFKGLQGPDYSSICLTYVGTLSDSYPMETFLNCLEEYIKVYSKLTFRLIGSVSENWMRKLKNVCGERVEFTGYVEHSQAVRYMSSSTALLLVVPAHASARGILPGKLFEYLASSRPVIGLGPVESDAANILNETGAGIMLDPNDEEGIETTLERYITDIRSVEKDLKPSVRERYSRRNLTGVLAELLNGIG